MVSDKVDKLRFIKLLFKEQLKSESQLKEKHDYIKEAKTGTLIAFKIGENDSITSGKLVKTTKSNDGVKVYLIESKDGEIHTVKNESIVWVKTGQRWPRQIFEELKKSGGK